MKNPRYTKNNAITINLNNHIPINNFKLTSNNKKIIATIGNIINIDKISSLAINKYLSLICLCKYISYFFRNGLMESA